MRILRKQGGTVLWLSAHDTYAWSRRWPCSELAGRRLVVEFDARGDLIDLAIDGRFEDCSGSELDAIVADFLGSSHPEALK